MALLGNPNGGSAPGLIRRPGRPRSLRPPVAPRAFKMADFAASNPWANRGTPTTQYDERTAVANRPRPPASPTAPPTMYQVAGYDPAQGMNLAGALGPFVREGEFGPSIDASKVTGSPGSSWYPGTHQADLPAVSQPYTGLGAAAAGSAAGGAATGGGALPFGGGNPAWPHITTGIDASPVYSDQQVDDAASGMMSGALTSLASNNQGASPALMNLLRQNLMGQVSGDQVDFRRQAAGVNAQHQNAAEQARADSGLGFLGFYGDQLGSDLSQQAAQRNSLLRLLQLFL